jgi:hypothetical protein
MSNKEPIPRPTNVDIGVKLLYSSLIIGILSTIMEYPEIIKETGASLGLVFLGIFLNYAPAWFLVFMIGKGKNWARITLLILFIIGSLISIFEAVQSPGHAHDRNLLYYISTVCLLTGLVWLFQKDASAWFRMMKNPKDAIVPGDVLAEQEEPEPSPDDDWLLLSASSDEPLFVLKYATYKAFLRRVLYFLLSFFLGVITIIIVTKPWTDLGHLVTTVLVGLLFLASVFQFIEVLLFEEIHLYKDRIVKSWIGIGKTEVILKNASLMGQNDPFLARKIIFDHDTNRFVAFLKRMVFKTVY